MNHCALRVCAALVGLAACRPATLGAQMSARRVDPGACPNLTDPSIQWAASVRGFSNQYNNAGWSARQALGRPDVFPRHGDIAGTWSTLSSGSSDWIDLSFAAPAFAGEVWVFETYGVGGLYRVTAIEANGAPTPLWSTTPVRGRGTAGQMLVPVVPARPLLGVRLEVSPSAAGGYVQIDAVGAVPPTAACLDGPKPLSGVAASRRLSPAEYSASPIPGGAVWARGVASFTTQYGTSGWDAQQIVGPPTVFPAHGDLVGAWAPSSTANLEDAIVVAFPTTWARQIWVFETYGVGGLFQIFDVSGGAPTLLWSAAPAVVSAREARVLRVDLPAPRPISALRLVVAPATVRSYPELDAVALVP